MRTTDLHGAPRNLVRRPLLASLPLLVLLLGLGACTGSQTVRAGNGDVQESITTVGVTSVTRKPIMRQLTVSS
jgi:hypothetical protein